MSNANVFDESMLFDNKFELREVVDPIAKSKSYIATDSVSGQVVGASTGTEYRRLYIRKLYDKLVYGCRMSDTITALS